MKPRASMIIATSLFGIPFLAGCGGSGGSSSAPLITPQPRSVSAKAANGLTVTFSENADAVSQVGSVSYTVTLTNPTTQPVTIQLGASCFGSPNPNYPDDTLIVTSAAGIQISPVAIEVGAPCAPNILPVVPVMQTLNPGQTLTNQGTLNSASLSQLFTAKGVYTLNVRVQTSSSSTATTVGPLPLTVQ